MEYIFKLKCDNCEQIFYDLDSLDKHNNYCNKKVTKIIDFPPSSDNISVKICLTPNCHCVNCLKFGYHAATAVHEPSGQSNEVVEIIRELPEATRARIFMEILMQDPAITAVRGLKEKMEINAHT